MNAVTLHHGDCLDVLATLPDASVDSIVTDPPYGLGFMGKEWDDLPPGVEWAAECLRVLKPGGHLLAFGGSRTWHRLAAAVEDAGFEIRDSIAWLYGSGFPKSLDVSKAIDKQRTEDVEPVRVICRAIRAAMDVRDLKSRHLVEHFEGCHPRLIDHWAARDTDSQPSLPTWEQWEMLGELFPELAQHDAEVWRLNGRKGTPGHAWDQREVVGTTTSGGAAAWSNGLANMDGAKEFTGQTEWPVTAPATPAAEQWQGWGTALKPAFEPIVVGRKPLAGTVAANVTTHGTGALNVDACRIAGDVPPTTTGTGFSTGKFVGSVGLGDPTMQGVEWKPNTAGRWPANVILDESQAAALDEQSGTLTSGANPTRRGSDGDRTVLGSFGGQADANPQRGIDKGGASRFFYVAKAPKSERPRTDDGTAHPTVKPLALMRWLVRLVTPPGGVVLEPFAGSGTTVEACLLEGFRCIAIEREADYLPLIEARINRVAAKPKPDLGLLAFLDEEETA